MANTPVSNRAIAEIAFGGLGAIGLGAALIPLRESVSASNLAFVLLAWTIVIAEMGGRAAALLTALMSALSLNFFLTQPYLTLQIRNPGDIWAFVALAGCGLIAAAFGRRRQVSEVEAGRAHEALATVRRAERALERRGAGGEVRLASVVDEMRESLGLHAVALRDPTGATLAVSPGDFIVPATAPARLEPDSLIPEGDDEEEARYLRMGTRGLRLPEGGGRLVLQHGGRPVGAVDLWERDTSGLDTDQITALWVIARLVAADLGAPRGGGARQVER